MKLRQIQYVCTVARNGLNVSAAAEALFTSQPGVSKQIRQIEDELGAQIFERSGRQFTCLTAFGRGILPYLERIQHEVDNTRRTAQELTSPGTGTLSIATTHTQARYALPDVISAFRARYPAVRLNLHQGTPDQIAALAVAGKVDIAIATEGLENFDELVLFPCYLWNRAVVVPKDHPLAQIQRPTLEDLASYPLVTYVFSFTDRSKMTSAFARRRLEPNLVLTATDAEVIKTYVRSGLGVGIIARMAYEPIRDTDLACIDIRHLFQDEVTSIGLRRGLVLSPPMYDFIHRFAPHLDRIAIDTALLSHDIDKGKRLFRAHLPYLTLLSECRSRITEAPPSYAQP
ncbi:transcriptional regulator CysB [Acidihalobacter yilgarnensis]|uniref:Transcriptional regulator CysB n=1 Tax=Acidihalobacter yilgarnensis TaxID=2819280 RepID=A0A1D8ILW6_9GAMM|nr:HTH-type transcriptional regulator CysB [Acidihalobacter yilgarnensis]AOU97441.1 transcriptional regulator CysB [Acidihalobacter yilgarnensis]